MYITPKNCTAELINGTICVTSIDNIKDGVSGTSDDTEFDYEAMRKTESISVVISAICEGIGSISKEFHVAIKHDSKPYVSFVMDNQNASVSWNTKAQKYISLPYTVNLNARRADESVAISGVTVHSGDDITTTSTINEDGSASVTFNSLPRTLGNVTDVPITIQAIYAGISYEQTIVHTINRYEDVNVYELKPSVTQVVASVNTNGDKVASVDKVTCEVLCNSSDDKQYYLTSSDMENAKLTVKYSVDGGTTFADYTSDGVAVSPEWENIIFRLYLNEGLIDSQDVPVMLNGVDGNGSEWIYYLSNSATFTGINPHDWPAKQEDGYIKEDTGWTDDPSGVTETMQYEWISQRTKKDGKWGTFSQPTIWAKWGEKGDNAVEYSLRPNMTSIIIDDNNKNISGDSLSVTLYKSAGSSTVQSNDYNIFAYYVNNEGTKTAFGQSSGFPSPVGVTITFIADDLAAYFFEVHDSNSNILAVLTVPVVRHGKPSMSIVDRGLFDLNSGYGKDNGGYSYKYVNGTLVRDMVKYLNKTDNAYYYYMVKNRTDLGDGNVMVSPGEDSSKWEQVSKYNLLFADVVYADNATIGGFHVNQDALWTGADTQEGATILLDGKNAKVRITGEVNATSGTFNGTVNATSGIFNNGTFGNCTITATCKAGFMRYSANKMNGNVINCGLVNLIEAHYTYNVTTFYLPSVGIGEFMRIVIMNIITTRITIPDFTLGIEGDDGVFNDFYNFPPGDKRYTTPITISRNDYYEFLGMNNGSGTMWICTNKAIPRI